MKLMFRAAVLLPMLSGFGQNASASATLPSLRPGWWQGSMVMLMNMKGQPPDTDSTPTLRYNCYDAADIARGVKMLAGGMGMNCTTDLEGSDGSYTIAMSCPSPVGGAGTIKSQGTMVFDGDTAFHMAETMSADIPNMQMTGSTTEDGKWLGACPDGVAPGDYGVMQNGAFQKQGNIKDNGKPPGQ